MKTATSIEAQEERKGPRTIVDSSRELTQPVTRKSKRGDASRIAAWRWQPGKSANPGGVPKVDYAKQIARAVFENNPEMLYQAYCKMMRRGNAYCFQVLADRAYGKLREVHQLDVPFRDTSTEDLAKEIERLEIALGYRKAEEELPPVR